MGTSADHPAVRRVADALGVSEAVSVLAAQPAQDVVSFLLAVSAARTEPMSPTGVMRRSRLDRFVQPGVGDARVLASLEAAALAEVGSRFEPVVLATLVPLGTHAVLGGVAQHRVVSTVRNTEVLADPTASLALVVAQRRTEFLRQGRAEVPVRLSGVGRVTRAQRFEGPRSFAHFSLLGLVTGARGADHRRFEHAAIVDHVDALASVARAYGPLRVELTDFGGRLGESAAAIGPELAVLGVEVVEAPERTAGRGYYTGLCFKMAVRSMGEWIEIGDGGAVDWTQRLMGSSREQLMTSGLSLERLAGLAPRTAPAGQASAVRLRWLRPDDESGFVAAHRAMTTDRFVFGLGYDERATWADYLRMLADEQRGIDLRPGRVPATFLVAEHEGRIVGRVSIRHRLNDFLEREGGHIGYGVVPECRKRGFATSTLQQALVIARSHGVDRPLLVCDDDNVASARVIERCGGVLDNVVVGADGVLMRRYWIG